MPHSSKADKFYFLTLVIRILLVHHRWFLRITNTELSEEIHEKRPVQIFTQLVQDKPEKFITKYLAGIVKVILAYFFAELHFLQWNDILFNPGMQDLQKSKFISLKNFSKWKLVSEYFVCYLSLSLFIEVPDQWGFYQTLYKNNLEFIFFYEIIKFWTSNHTSEFWF